MISPTAGSRGDARAGHIDLDELADAYEGLVDDERARVIEAHLAGCSECSADADALAGVPQELRSQPAEPMPQEVFARLQSVVADEQDRRTAAADTGRGHTPVGRPGIGYHKDSYPTAGREQAGRADTGPAEKPPLAERFADLTGPGGSGRALRAKVAGGALAATLIAGTAGFGGYVASAAAGTAEPPAADPAVVSSTGFAEGAAEVRSADPKSYRFTQAWSCARAVTDGKITGIKSTVLNGRSGYLVFLAGDNADRVVFVTDCDTPTPTSGPTATLPNR